MWQAGGNERLTYVVPDEWMDSKRIMLFRLDEGCMLMTQGGTNVRSMDVPKGRHIVLTNALGTKEYHLTRALRGQWRAIRV